MRKIAVTSCIFLFILCLTLAGCSGGGSNNKAAEPGSGSDQNNESASTDKGKVQEITFWGGYGPESDMPNLIKMFEKEHPDIKVKNEYFPSHTALLQKVQVVSSSGAKPDLIAYDMINVPITNQLLPLVDLNPYIELETDFKLDDFYPAFREFGAIDGKQLSLHMTSNNLLLFYNKKLFKEAGLNPEVPPKTWDELRTAAKALTKPGQWGYQITGVNDEYFESLSWQFQTMVWQNGGEIWNGDFTAPAFNDEKGYEALQFLVDLIEKDKVTPLNAPEKGFENGRVGMILQGTWMTKDYEDNLGADLGAAFLPQKQQYATNVGGNELMMVQSDEARQQAAWEFFKFLMSKDVQITLSKSSGELPSRKSIMEDPEFQTYLTAHPAYKVSADQMQYGKYRAPITKYLAASEALYKELQKAVYGKSDPKDALDNASSAINGILAAK
jgi:ABC-type glycerol-3-phosphate transport system substrate-binding protein